MKFRIDTHIHTTASDGTLYPEELLEEILEKNIEIFSITDHDSIDNIKAMKNLTKNLDLVFIPGVEISVTYEAKEIHLLVYGKNINKENSKLMEFISYNEKMRINFEKKFMEYVSKKFNISIDEYNNFERDPKEGGWKTYNFLKSKNIIKSLADIFTIINETGLSLIFKSPDEIIPKLKELGLTIVLAHPSAYYKNKLLSIKFLNYFKGLGIDGIECNSPYFNNKEKHIDYYKKYCKKNNLLIMFGSDYHGKFISTRELGMPESFVDKVELDKILKTIGN